jgi:hypothetical protein
MKTKATMLILAIVFTISVSSIKAQQVPATLWQDIEKPTTAQSVQRDWLPFQYRFMQLDIATLKSMISNAPDELNTTAAKSNFVLALPMPDGNIQKFAIVYAPFLHRDLAQVIHRLKLLPGKELPTLPLPLNVI